ncbi:MAG: hypothetical protein ACYTXC_26055 [Nostoc sp.]
MIHLDANASASRREAVSRRVLCLHYFHSYVNSAGAIAIQTKQVGRFILATNVLDVQELNQR